MALGAASSGRYVWMAAPWPDEVLLVRALAIIQRFREQHPSVRPIVSSGNCKVQLYGEEMRSMPGVAARAFSVVSSITNEIMLITTSEVDISILIAQHELSSVLDALKQHYGI